VLGIPVARGVVAVDPKIIPLRSRLLVPGYGKGIAADVGTAIRGRIIDLWFPTPAEARAWGRRTVVVTVRPPS
jgi:3D (Asp-Asp-Asp) domain-containing protein